jgi:urease accessory protein
LRAGREIAVGATVLLVLKQFTNNDPWVIWQIADSAFPSGGFAHSGGLEAAWQCGEIRSGAELASYIEAGLWQAARGMVPLVIAAHNEPARVEEFDELCDCFLSNHVANRASRLQGRAFVNSAHRIFGSMEIEQERLHFSHLAPVFGAVTRVLSINRSTAAELFLFQALRGMAAAAVRLGIVGPMEAQGLQHRLAARAREILSLTEGTTIDEVATVTPLLEIWQATHDRLYSRLFQT